VSHQTLRAGNPKFDRLGARGDEEVAALECRAIDAHRVSVSDPGMTVEGVDAPLGVVVLRAFAESDR